MSCKPFLVLGCLLLCISCNSGELNNLEDVSLQDAVGIERATDVEILYSDSAVVRVAVEALVLLRNTDKKKTQKYLPERLES
jgi:hypothetical protein